MDEFDFEIPDYIKEEIKEYQEEVKSGRDRCMKWENIKALLRMAEFNNRLTEEQIKKIIDKYSLEGK